MIFLNLQNPDFIKVPLISPNIIKFHVESIKHQTHQNQTFWTRLRSVCALCLFPYLQPALLCVLLGPRLPCVLERTMGHARKEGGGGGRRGGRRKEGGGRRKEGGGRRRKGKGGGKEEGIGKL